MLLFQPQQNPPQLLNSLLIALSFSAPLESRDVQEVIEGYTANTRFYLSNLKKSGYLKNRDGLLHLSAKARKRTEAAPFEMIFNRRGGIKLRNHEILLVRTLFLCLQHLDHQHIEFIRKEKPDDGGLIPDLRIVTQTNNLYIEIDTGTQPLKVIENKLRKYQITGREEKTVIYFTNSKKHFDYFKQNSYAHFIFLRSPTLTGDILKLQSSKSNSNKSKNIPSSRYYKIAPNVFLRKDLIPDEVTRLRQEYMKKFYEK